MIRKRLERSRIKREIRFHSNASQASQNSSTPKNSAYLKNQQQNPLYREPKHMEIGEIREN